MLSYRITKFCENNSRFTKIYEKLHHLNVGATMIILGKFYRLKSHQLTSALLEHEKHDLIRNFQLFFHLLPYNRQCVDRICHIAESSWNNLQRLIHRAFWHRVLYCTNPILTKRCSASQFCWAQNRFENAIFKLKVRFPHQLTLRSFCQKCDGETSDFDGTVISRVNKVYDQLELFTLSKRHSSTYVLVGPKIGLIL